jgi:transposase
MAFIRKVKTASGATAVQIAFKIHGKITRLIHIGSAHTEEELQVLLGLAKQKLIGSQQSLFPKSDSSANRTFKIGLKQSFSELLFKVLTEQYNALGFDNLADEDFANLCVARIVEPTSKLDSLRVLADLGINGLSKNRLYRCLARTVEHNYRSKLEEACFKHASMQGISLVLYDVTTLYFEIQKEDEYRKPGMSKERRLEPQIIVGLLVDQQGFPLGLHSFEGNTAETNTILPVIEQFKARHGLTEITVVADAGMMSAKNLEALTLAGYHYIVGSRLHKIPYDIAEYQKTGTLSDSQTITVKLKDSRIIYQYKEKRAALDIRNIQKQIAKAQKVISGQSPVKKTKFLSTQTKDKKLNQALVAKAYALAGVKGYVTNLDLPDKQIIGYYHQLFAVEASFRMAKSDLRARPIFHHKRDSIEAHLTVVLGALSVARIIESRTGISIKQFVKTLKPIRSGTVTINGREYVAEAEIPPAVIEILKNIKN